jgi:integrase
VDVMVRYQEYKKTEAVDSHVTTLSAFFKGCAVSHICNPLMRDYAAQRLAQYTTIGARKGKKTVSPSSVRRELGTLAAALSFAKRERLIGEVPHIERPDETPPRERWLTPKEQAALIDACANPHILAFVMIGLNTGARPSSILELKWFQVDTDAAVIHFNPEGRAQTKKNRPSVSINSALLPVLLKLRKDATCEYVISFKGKPVRSVKKAFRDACKRAGITGATPYTLRHTAITMMVRGGVSLALAGSVAGHKDPRTTSRYAKHDPSFTADAVQVLAAGENLAQLTAKKAIIKPKSSKKKVEIQCG